MDGDRGPVAAIDCGTNSTRLLVVGADGSTLERHMRITRLGEGVDATRLLSPGAMARTVEVLADYGRIMEGRGVVRARVVATSAVRDAANAEEFLSSAQAVTGIRPELLSGDEEGTLSFAGATAHLPPAPIGPGPVLVVDIGGGSTELVAGDRPAAPGSATPDVVVVSLDIGCVRMSERFLRHDPPLPKELAAARAAVDIQLGRARAGLPPLAPGGLLVGLAGTVSTLAALAREIPVYDRVAIHHAVLGRGDVERWLGLLSAEDSRARLARPGMLEGRADVIVAGVLILAAVMADLDRRTCLVSEDDILDGLVASMQGGTP